MKTKHSALACMLAAFGCITACTEDIPAGGGINSQAIGFGIDEASFTRGTPVTEAKGIPNMGVYGYYTGDGDAGKWANKGSNTAPDFLNGITVTQTNGTWSYTGKAYWPNAENANVSFFAYSPVAGSGNGITVAAGKGVPTLIYEVSTDCTKQPDLMVAEPKLNCNKKTGTITFSMKHALTAVGFKLSGGGQKVTSIKMKGVRTSGTLSMDGSSIQWSNLNDPQNTEFSSGLSSSGLISTDVLTDIVAGNGYLMMIPQELGADATLTVEFENWPTETIKLSGAKWEVGQKVIYGLSMPESELVGQFIGEVKTRENGDYTEYYYSDVLEIAAFNSLEDIQWATNINATGINDRLNGKLNTLNLYKKSSANYPAAKYCMEKNKNYSSINEVDHSDYMWYLPSQNELMAVVMVMPILRSSPGSVFFWSSSDGAESAWTVCIRYGTAHNIISGSNFMRTEARPVRCARKQVTK